ncbi:hypothetical protein ACFVQ9_26470 [Streptomyces goshikiensis]|uniref:hypothetical protein n=1 Tax=Streptomyces goshikiensis TaxID=1942 RepID=UPI003676F4E2
MSDARDEAPSRAALAETIRSIESYAGTLGRQASDVFNTRELHLDTGIEERVIEQLLRGDAVEEDDLPTRIYRRFTFLRETYRRSDGQQFSLKEIAESFQATGPALAPLTKAGKANPGPATQLGVTAFFNALAQPSRKVGEAFLTARCFSALNDALQPLAHQLAREVLEVQNVRISARQEAPGDELDRYFSVMSARQKRMMTRFAASILTEDED